MSHYSILVIGDDIEQQMAPYDENLECPPRKRYLDTAAEDLVAARAHYAGKPGELSRDLVGTEPPRTGAGATNAETTMLSAWHSQRVYAEDGPNGTTLYWHEDTTNEGAKWDWYTVGGRWAGHLVLKPEFADLADSDGEDSPNYDDNLPRTSAALAGQVDWARMRELARERAETDYDRFEQVTAGLPIAEPWTPVRERWAARSADEARTAYANVFGTNPFADARLARDERKQWLKKAQADGGRYYGDTRLLKLAADDFEALEREVAGPENITYARREFNDQLMIAALRQAKMDGWLDDPVEMWCVHDGGRAAYVERAQLSAGTTFAVLWKGQWYANGEMGWWGHVHNPATDDNEWRRRWHRLVAELPDDILLTVVDAHI